jgi:hypothetical protein
MISSFLIPWTCVVTLNMALKPYLKLYSGRQVVIQLQFRRQGSRNDVETCLNGL